MAKWHQLLLSFVLLSVLLRPQHSLGQSIEFSNETAYITELLTHSSANPGRDTHLLGWFLNTSTLKVNERHSFNVGLMLTHGGEPSVDIVGDLQTFSNLETGFFYGFNEVYYQYESEKFWVKVGQQDINTDFLVSENGALFTHSSFGIDPVATINMPAPTYPVTAFSLTSSIDVNPNLNLKIGVFDGQFATPNNDYLGINWSLNKDEGLIYIVEPEFKLFNGKLSQKIGYYHHSGEFLNHETLNMQKGLSAFYLVSDLNLMQNGDKAVNLFLQFDRSTKAVSDLRYYYGLGLKFDNLIKSERQNELGIGLGHARLNSQFSTVAEAYDIDRETFIEINYKHQIKDWLSIQPYFQWINIDALNSDPKNPVIAALRAYIEF